MIECPLKAALSDSPAWIDSDRIWSYRELDELADRWVADLKRSCIGPGSRIAVLHRPCAALAALFFAAWRLQASICPLNLRLPKAGIDHFLKRLNPDLYLTDLTVGHEKSPVQTVDPKIPALFLMTSGSTAEPKIAVLSLENLLANAKGALNLLDLKPKDRWLLNLPLFHVGGIGILIRCVLARAAVALQASDPEITHISCVPTQLYRASPVYKGLKCVLLGGAPIHSYPKHLPIVVTYGLTEMGSIVLAKSRPENGSLGFPLVGREAKIAEDGEILLRGECLFLGYWKEGRLENSDEWFGTKDLGRLDLQHGIAIVGRKDWQFISGGENIQPEEIEKHLLQIPGVSEAAVLPVPDAEFGFRPVAFASGSIDFETMKTHLLDRLPKYKIPVELFRLEEFPKNGFKIDRRALFLILSNKYFN